MIGSLIIVVLGFAASTGLAEALGAKDLGTAMSFGQIGFALALLYVLVRR